ncbi:NADH dehydrogenase [ubiquinone] 1 beta subcomplex subunit 8, mitochondrial-like [Saccostrea echinata]|uniref:NADH dehydrogenase [ubiquinone] 1 beta subcomplex subunit 8, mitochondrial-like n=1 Tax=Saccostrea echinata TaxID=191078 RepID=UPI002A7F1ACD|nr:NADH dehydrogenase [ubiquinone] 1 beta subcomplex subunit 8, mitochondrial-like [Saccostrea echinata]
MAAVGLGRVIRRFQPISVIRRCISTTPKVGAVYWEKDFLPGPYPKTEEERRAAAKKYGMQPEDYEPYDPELGWGTGDYPNVEPIGKDLRSDFDQYDNYRLKKNFNEPLPYDFDWVDKVDYGCSYHPHTEREIVMFLFSLVGFFILGEYLCNKYIPRHVEALPKQYPYTYTQFVSYRDPSEIQRTVHYTFEPADSKE